MSKKLINLEISRNISINAGGHSQKGCYQQTEMSPGSCNHDRAPQYYAESINSELGFWGYRCRKKKIISS